LKLITEIVGFNQDDSYQRGTGGVVHIKRGGGRDKNWFIVSMAHHGDVMVATLAVRKVIGTDPQIET
jgi:hypothetical protein